MSDYCDNVHRNISSQIYGYFFPENHLHIILNNNAYNT